ASLATQPLVRRLTRFLAELISETNGLSLEQTLELACHSLIAEEDPEIGSLVGEFHELLRRFRIDEIPISRLLDHPFSEAMRAFFGGFPITYRDEHTHLTGSLDAEFIYPRLDKLLGGPNRDIYEAKIAEVYGA